MAKITWHGNEVAEKINKQLLDGAERWILVDVKTDAHTRCPKDRGVMDSTHTTERDEKSVVLGVGGPAAPYTLKQHEDASLHHHEGQEDHWLQNAFNRQLPKLQERLKG